MSNRKFTDLPPWVEKIERWLKTKSALKLAMVASIFFALFEVYSLIKHQLRLNESRLVQGVITDLTHARRGKIVHFEFNHNEETYRGTTRIYRLEAFFTPNVGESIEIGVLNNDGTQHFSNLPGSLISTVIRIFLSIAVGVVLFYRSR
ncbi:MAG: hypothetical protein NT027_01555 [Proteobacteria bacterium]|nr:hypothetical protein [Pseudomonadota bacterium]